MQKRAELRVEFSGFCPRMGSAFMFLSEMLFPRSAFLHLGVLIGTSKL